MKEPIPSQLIKYDIDQKIIRTLANYEARLVLFSIKNIEKSEEEIALEKWH